MTFLNPNYSRTARSDTNKWARNSKQKHRNEEFKIISERFSLRFPVYGKFNKNYNQFTIRERQNRNGEKPAGAIDGFCNLFNWFSGRIDLWIVSIFKRPSMFMLQRIWFTDASMKAFVRNLCFSTWPSISPMKVARDWKWTLCPLQEPWFRLRMMKIYWKVMAQRPDVC